MIANSSETGGQMEEQVASSENSRTVEQKRKYEITNNTKGRIWNNFCSFKFLNNFLK